MIKLGFRTLFELTLFVVDIQWRSIAKCCQYVLVLVDCRWKLKDHFPRYN